MRFNIQLHRSSECILIKKNSFLNLLFILIWIQLSKLFKFMSDELNHLVELNHFFLFNNDPMDNFTLIDDQVWYSFFHSSWFLVFLHHTFGCPAFVFDSCGHQKCFDSSWWCITHVPVKFKIVLLNYTFHLFILIFLNNNTQRIWFCWTRRTYTHVSMSYF